MAETGATIGIDVGGTKMLGVVLDARQHVLARVRRPTPAGAPEIIEALGTLVGELAEQAGAGREIHGTGVGIAGLVDLDGRLRRAPNLTDADGLAVRDLLQPRLGHPVAVDNDANCAARAELQLGVARDVDHALLVTLGTGIGGAVIVGGGVSRGAAGLAGEPGHMMVDPNGPACVCGLRGCWERYASGTGLAHLGRLAAEAGELAAVLDAVGGDTTALRGEHLTNAARSGDPEADAVLDRFAWWVAVGIANCAALLDPEMVIVGGGLVRDWDLFGARVSEHLEHTLLAAAERPALRCEPAVAGESAGAVGAALLAAEDGGAGSRSPG